MSQSIRIVNFRSYADLVRLADAVNSGAVKPDYEATERTLLAALAERKEAA